MVPIKLDLNEDRRKRQVEIIGAVMHETFSTTVEASDRITLQSLIDRNYIFFTGQGYELAWRGEAAAADLLRKSLIMLTPTQLSILSRLAEGTYIFQPGEGRAIKILKEAGYLAKSSAGWHITPDGRQAIGAEAQPEAEPEVFSQDEAEVEFNMERVTDKAVKRKRRAPDAAVYGEMGIQVVPRNDIAPLPPAPAAAEACAPDCQDCLPRKALALILKKHPEYQPVLEALRVLHQFEE